MSTLRSQAEFDEFLKELTSDLDKEHILLALKKINEQQMMFIDFSSLNLISYPNLNVLHMAIREIEEFLFERDPQPLGHVKSLIQAFLSKCVVA